jgi:uncharacterized RDD family membrane protein YckC
MFNPFFGSRPDERGVRYAGFNIRVFANLIDMLLLLILISPLLMFTPKISIEEYPPQVQEAIYKRQNNLISDKEYVAIVVPYLKSQLYSADFVKKFVPLLIAQTLIFALVFVLFWRYKNSTPGKMLFKLRIIDDKTLEDPSTKQYIIRFIGYIIASIPLGLGFLIVAFNKRKKGLHDYMAGTSVIFISPEDPVRERKMFKYQTVIFLLILLIFFAYISMK